MKNKSNSPGNDKIKEAAKMIESGIPIEVVCRMLKIPQGQLQHLRQENETHFK